MNKYLLSFIFLSIFLFSSCSQQAPQTEQFITEEWAVREKAYQTALLYLEEDTEYEWGGQDPLRTIKIDCSGLVVMCYTYAVENSVFYLPFSDAASYDLYQKYSYPVEKPERGDVVFMGNTQTSEVSHIAVFEKEENGLFWFIDSTLKDSDRDGINDINGVTRRSYDKQGSPIISFGRIILLKK